MMVPYFDSRNKERAKKRIFTGTQNHKYKYKKYVRTLCADPSAHERKQ